MAGLKAYGFWPGLVPGEVPGAAVFSPPKLPNKLKGETGAAPNPAVVGVVEVGDVVEWDVVDVVDTVVLGFVLGEPGAGNEDAAPNGDIPKAPGPPPAKLPSRSTADIWSIC